MRILSSSARGIVRIAVETALVGHFRNGSVGSCVMSNTYRGYQEYQDGNRKMASSSS